MLQNNVFITLSHVVTCINTSFYCQVSVYEYATICLSVYLLKVIWVVLSVGLLMDNATVNICVCLLVNIFLFL